MPRATVSVIDPDPAVRARLAVLLAPLKVEVDGYASAAAFFAGLEGATAEGRVSLPICLVSDARLPDLGGLKLLAELQRRGLSVPTILLSDDADIAEAVAAMRAGALDFVDKAYLDRAVGAQVAALLDGTR